MGRGMWKASGAAGRILGLHLGGNGKDVCLTTFH